MANDEARKVMGFDSGGACDARRETIGSYRRKKRRAILPLILILAVIAMLISWQSVAAACAWLLDADAVRTFVAEHDVASRFALVGINMLQVLLAFLPGEPVELAGGYAFGFWEGTLLCLVASGLATGLIYAAVRRWGWSVVGLFFDRSQFERFSWLKDTRRLELLMLAIFLIPGTPKDFLTYFAGLTRMRFPAVLAIATLGRIPSIVTSTMAASAFGNGDYEVAVMAVAVAGALIVLGGFVYRALERRGKAKS